MRSAFDHPHGCGKQPPCRRAAAQPPHATWRVAFGGRLTAAHGVCAGCAGAPLEERVALATPVARRAGRGHTDRSSEGRKAGASGPRALRGVVSRPDLPDGRRWPEPELAGEVAVGVLRAWQARNCVPKPFHYFELVLLTPLRQPKLGPPPSQPWSSRRARRETLRILRRPSILHSCAS